MPRLVYPMFFAGAIGELPYRDERVYADCLLFDEKNYGIIRAMWNGMLDKQHHHTSLS